MMSRKTIYMAFSRNKTYMLLTRKTNLFQEEDTNVLVQEEDIPVLVHKEGALREHVGDHAPVGDGGDYLTPKSGGL